MEFNEQKLQEQKENAINAINKSKRFVAVVFDGDGKAQVIQACKFTDELAAALSLYDLAINEESVPILVRLATEKAFMESIYEMRKGDSDDD